MQQISKISSLQIFQLLRYSATLIINIILAKTYLSLDELGQFEAFIFYFSFVSFFWINGFIQALLVNYKSSENNNNKARLRKLSVSRPFATGLIMQLSTLRR